MVRIRGGSVSAGRIFSLRDEEDEDVQVVKPSIKSPKKRTGNRGGKTKQSAKKMQTVQTTEPSVESTDEQMEEQQSEEHPVSGEQQDAEKNVEEQQTAEPSTRKSPRTRSGVQSTVPTTHCTGKRKRPANEQPEAQTAEETTPLPKFIVDDARERWPDDDHDIRSTNTFIAKRNLLMPPIPQENKNAYQKELRTEPTTETTRAPCSSSQSQNKGKALATEAETEEDNDDDDEDTEEEEDPSFA
nr:nucleolin-like [Coffea arabica]